MADSRRLIRGLVCSIGALVLAPVLAVGCGDGSDTSASSQGVGPVEVAEQEVAVAGRWQPPADVVTLANAQRVSVVDPPPISPLGSCSSADLYAACTHPACSGQLAGTEEIRAWILREFQSNKPADRIRDGGSYNCRRNTGSPDYLSVHAVGRAIDIMVETGAGGDANNTAGDRLANFLISHAEHIGIQRVGWDGKWFNGERGFGQDMCSRSCGASDYPSGCWPCNPHVDHLHIEVSVDAAQRKTRFFTEGPPGQTCPVVCYGNAAVAQDCSFVNCEDSGQVCLPNPVRCAPDEAPNASHHPGAPMPALELLGAPSRFEFVGPSRVFDTRGEDARLARSSDGVMVPDEVGTVTTWPAGVPSDARGVWMNAVATQAQGTGFLQVYPSGPTPDVSTLNYTGGSVSNAAPVWFGVGGGVDVVARGSGAHVIADVYGAFKDAGYTLRNVAPSRVLDTRSIGEPIPAQTPYRIRVAPPARADAKGVVASVAVINSEPGFLSIYACDQPVSEASSVNFEGDGVVANTVISRLSSDDEVCVWSWKPVHLVFDVTGFLVPEAESELSYQSLKPVRLLDTRKETGLYRGRLGAGQVLEIPIQSLAGAPAQIGAIVVNLTSVNASEVGFLTMWPCGTPAPITSVLNFDEGRPVVASLAMSAIGDDGKLCVSSFQRTHLLIDALGVWVPTEGGAAPTPADPPQDPNPGITDGPETDAGGTPPGADAGSTDIGVDAGTSEPNADAGLGDVGEGGASTVMVAEGSCAVGSSSPGSLSLILLALLGVCWRRRRIAE